MSFYFFDKLKRKKEIIEFLNTSFYYQIEFPFPCNKEKILIKDNYKLFELVFLEYKDQINLENIFSIEKKITNSEIITRNCILGFDLHDLYKEEKCFKPLIKFENETFESPHSLTFNIYKFIFNNQPIYHIHFYFTFWKNYNEMKNKKSSYFYLIKECDLINFKNYIFPQFIKFEKEELNIKQKIDWF